MTKCCKNITVNVSHETSVLLLFLLLTGVNSTIGCIKLFLIFNFILIDLMLLICIMSLMIYLKLFIKNNGKSITR
jgi:hypothetical protein